jgi:hypothetical protein
METTVRKEIRQHSNTICQQTVFLLLPLLEQVWRMEAIVFCDVALCSKACKYCCRGTCYLKLQGLKTEAAGPSLSTRLHGVTCHKAATPNRRRKKSQIARDCKLHANASPQNPCNFFFFLSLSPNSLSVTKKKKVCISSHYWHYVTQRPWQALPGRGLTAKTDDIDSKWL